MTKEEIAFIKELLIKLDVVIDTEHQQVSLAGIDLIFDFTKEKRKQDILKALDILNKGNKNDY